MRKEKVAVLIPAAGQGTRMGGRRKQFRMLGGKPLLVQTLLVFERHPDVDYILVATPSEAVQALSRELRAVGITKLATVVAGGTTRQASVAAALRATPEPVGIVLVHDAVRPFVRPAQVAGVIDMVRRAGAAALAVPITDTLRKGQNECFGQTVAREGLFAMQTPQGFRRAWLEAAHVEAAHQGHRSTDDVELVQRLGYAVQLVPGSTRNIKITTPDDWEVAQVLWPYWEVERER